MSTEGSGCDGGNLHTWLNTLSTLLGIAPAVRIAVDNEMLVYCPHMVGKLN